MSTPPLPSAPAATGGPEAASTAGAAASSPSPDRAAGSSPQTEQRRPWLTVLVVLAVLGAVLASVARGYYRDGPLEPDAPTGQGSKAVVQVLEGLSVDVEVDRHTADAAADLRAGRTVLVTDPRGLSSTQLAALAEAHEQGPGRLVLVQPDDEALYALAPDITRSGSLSTASDLSPGPECGDLSQGARTLHVPGEDGLRGSSSLYRASGEARSCFAAEKGGLVAGADRLVVLGSADLLTNDGVANGDNSALVLNTLGVDGELTWYVPSAGDPLGSDGQDLLTYLPDWAGPLLLWLLLTAVIAVIAVARRFGPVVVEPLPVTVRPQEIVLGRARLLQQADARDAAATSLRSATATRLADRLGLRRESALDGLVMALAPHVDRSPEQLRTLLGPTPVPDDQSLVRLAQDLDVLEKEIDR
ncbi:DUF4350 domain-containing protein [Brachybacterium alimentarium]|uniref:DUF4350 domain-containing protein n=1 Tax=Brachybacterium alimentarium TaxID=47845 RepID=UPI000BB70450|nr:DUF4350 domain-containing protein [Brachybacterium alimentarium]PCC35685.1 hypothetical protein CIK71_01775 [Brachybacterium alimentarium]RCS66533.1 DUF4350 domain-containing protein [Brachybacterium alimentarium]